MISVAATSPSTPAERPPQIIVPVHPALVRITHWVNVFAMVCMIMSGWMIYNASPLFGFSFPAWATLGGWLGGAIAWHLAALRVPTKLGFKNPKHIAAIFVTNDYPGGYWEDQGYNWFSGS
jgi:hypothetical protein